MSSTPQMETMTSLKTLLRHSSPSLLYIIRPLRGFTTTWTSGQCVLILALVISLLSAHAQARLDAPCMGCRLFNLEHRLNPEEGKKDDKFCHYPCQCPYEELSCHEGVSTIKDGCGCCYMCARQMGDMCSVKDLCDAEKGLTCDNKDKNSTGVCKGKDKNPCFVDGVMYKDGEKFQPECSQLCTCQNGFYGCVNTCPQEMQRPSELTCHEPKLIKVKNKCCREWTCQKMEASGSSLLAGYRGLESQNLVLQNPMWYRTSTPAPPPTTPSLAAGGVDPCYKKTTDWTPCSVTCDVGVSMRIVVDPITCNGFQEHQLCYLRPCGKDVETLGREKCTPTTRSKQRYHIKYQDCISLKDYNLKFCTTCRKNRCCYPRRTRTRSMEFQCSDGKRETMHYMWIKKCRCDRSCDPNSNKNASRRGRGRGRSQDNKQTRAEKRREMRRRRRRRRRRRFNEELN